MATARDDIPDIRIDSPTLADLVSDCYRRVGLSRDDAEIVAKALVETDLRGIHSHGVIRVPFYIRCLQQGALNPSPNMRLERDRPATAVFDADHAPGQLGATKAFDIAIERARRFGVGVVSVKNSGHYGASSLYAMKAVPHDMIGMAWSNGFPVMSAWGGRGNNLTNGPLSYAIPAKTRPPVVLDTAMAAVAMGKARVLARAGQSFPPGVILDKDGRPSVDPDDLLNGGSSLPIGQHKGSGLSVVAEILSGVLGGGPFLDGLLLWYAHPDKPNRTGHFFMALDVGAFRDGETFKQDVDTFIEQLKTFPKMEGFEEILAPGEIEHRTALRNREAGIPLPSSTVADLRKVAGELGAEVPAILG
jgi:LDH2 family malate/lactate/ureidoglycolate dehydrogenase